MTSGWPGATINNLAGASFTITGPGQGDAFINFDGSAVSFTNAGSLVSNCTGSTGIESFSNLGSTALVNVLAGQLDVGGGSVPTPSTGRFSGAAGTLLEINTQSLDAASVVSSDGQVQVDGPSTIAGSYRAAGGTIADGPYGQVSFTGTVGVHFGSSLTVSGAVNFAAVGGPLTTGAITIAPGIP